jgi:hypothetical protein
VNTRAVDCPCALRPRAARDIVSRVGRFSLIETVRHLYRTNPSFTVYWTWATLLTACATVYLAVVASWIALLTLARCVFAVGVLAGGAMYGAEIEQRTDHIEVPGDAGVVEDRSAVVASCVRVYLRRRRPRPPASSRLADHSSEQVWHRAERVASGVNAGHWRSRAACNPRGQVRTVAPRANAAVSRLASSPAHSRRSAF